MNPKRLKEILAAHADQLIEGQAKDQTYSEIPVEDEEELITLLHLAEQVKSALKPVHPPNKFENRLKRELLTTAHLRQAEGYTAPNPERDLLILMAIVGFISSLAAVLVALKIRR
jgi:hypothetical protein